MLKSLRVFVGLCVALVSVGLSVGVSHATPDGEWSTFVDVPGLIAANTGGSAGVNTMSCASVGNCSAGGYYNPATDVQQAFVVSQVDGVWGPFEGVPGLAAVNTGNYANLRSISCAFPGNCSAVGFYYSDGALQAFVVSQVDGVWQSFVDVPGLLAANTGASAGVNTVSCASPGNCAAVGNYTNGAGSQGFVVSQVDGVWQSFVDVPGLLAANTGDDAGLTKVSCTSPGNCSAGGYYANDNYGDQLIVVSQVNGVWQSFVDVPGLAAVNTGNSANLNSISCAFPGNCSAGGYYYSDGAGYQAFVVSQVDGVWQSFVDVPGIAGVNTGGDSAIQEVSCGSEGNCAAVGYYSDADGYQAFVVSQVDGVWQSFVNVPGIAGVNTGGDAGLQTVSCASADNCSAGGYYKNGAGYQAFVTSISTPLPEPTTTTDAPTTTSDAPSTTTVPSTSVSTTVPSTSVSTTVPSTSVATTLLVTNLPATGNSSSSTVLMSLMLILSGALVVSGLRRRIS
jgi:LPXTG-motif cell wall-anchored protein